MTQNAAYMNQTPWHWGVDVRNLLTTDEAIEKGKLSWGVKKAPLVAHLSPELDKPVMGKYTITRDDNSEVIGIVGKNFRPVPNKEAFGIMDALAGEAGAKFESVGYIGLGERVWMLAKLPTELRIKTSEDILDKYLLFSNAFNGSKSFVMGFTPRLTRSNIILNVSRKGLSDTMSIRHTHRFDEQIKEVRRVLKLQDTYFAGLGDMCNHLCDVAITRDKFEEVLNNIMPLPTDGSDSAKTTSAREKLENLYNTENASNPYPDSGYALLCAAANYRQHHASYKSKKDDFDGTSKDQIRFLSITEGSAHKFTCDVVDLLLAE